MPNINIDDAYILGETGAQVDKVTGLFTKDENTTSGEKAFAQLNIGTAGSNRNLLDNPWFTAGNVVNQRGVATIPHTQYGIDRWKGEHGSATITVTNAGLAYQGTSADLYQSMESSLRTFLNGKTLTASVLKSDGTIESGSAVFTNGVKTQFIYNSETGADVFVSAAGNFNLRYLNRTSAVTVVACKLELGSVSTLANDAPPDYGEELLKCQRYFTRWYSTAGSSAIGLALAVATTNANFALLSNLRAEGSATVSFTGLVLSDGTDKTVTNVSVAGAGDGKSMRLLVTSSGLTAYRPYVLQITAGGHLDVSKDL